MCQADTDGLVGNEAGVDQLTFRVDAAGKPAAEQVDTHDAEDEPEHETYQQNVGDRRDRLDQRVHHHLQCQCIVQ